MSESHPVKGEFVARAPNGVRHIVDVVQGSLVLALCGNTIADPDWLNLRGPVCALCLQREDGEREG